MIEHDGMVISSDKDHAKIRIVSKAACVSCQLNGSCNMADVKEKEIDVSTLGKEYKAGEQVTIIGDESLGQMALFLGYILPFIVVMATLISCISLGYSELISGTASILILVPYYLSLKLFNNKIEKHFTFYLKNKE